VHLRLSASAHILAGKIPLHFLRYPATTRHITDTNQPTHSQRKHTLIQRLGDRTEWLPAREANHRLASQNTKPPKQTHDDEIGVREEEVRSFSKLAVDLDSVFGATKR